MRTILLVIPELDYGGASYQFSLVAMGLPRDRFRVHVAVLGGDNPLVRSLRDAGVDVEVLGWTRLLDLTAPVRFSQLVDRVRPDVVHSWHPPTALWLDLLLQVGKHRVAVSLTPRFLSWEGNTGLVW